MQEPQAEDFNEFDGRLLAPGLKMAMETDLWLTSQLHEPEKTGTSVFLPVTASILLHLSLLVMARQLMGGTDLNVEPVVTQAPSIQIRFQPRPQPPEPESVVAVEEVKTVEPLATSDAEPDTPADSRPQTMPDTPAEQAPEPEPMTPRLVAPALLDLRDMIQNRSQMDETQRLTGGITCDERQRRNQMLDCGEENANARLITSSAEQNPTVELFTGLNTPAPGHAGQPRDATNPDTRAAVARDNLTGNLGAGPLIRSVMGPP